ncbi:MAG: cytochrome c biogenesis protein CcsA [Saprospiraceae bacterium]|nr:cytochrome c biogenesis protein CcsA [Saprospiraceae bacterium]MBK9564908.1 cytochrome c biogenesis protein CcsA [Saprospiraceae bacterium]
MKGLWWKLSGVIIFLYVLAGGMTIALKPGITIVKPGNADSGDSITMSVTGYNTHFLSATHHRAWLKLDSINAVSATSIKAELENNIQLSFRIPDLFPRTERVQPLTLIMDNEKDGVFVQPNALFVRVGDSLIVEDVKWQDAGLHDFNTISGVRFPYRNILNETIRNTFFHVALWFAMFVLLVVGLYHAVQYLRTGIYDHDIQSSSFNRIAIMFGVLGLITGSIWAKFTWNTFWTTDVKLNMTAVAMLIYLAYLVLRGSSSDHDKRARISAAYSIFAFLALIPLVFVIPRLTDSLHPGNGGNPALGGEDLDYTLRLFFYPSIIALILLGTWMAALLTRYERIKEKILQKE